VLDVTERWFRFNFFSIMTHVDNLDKDIGGLFLLILHNGIGANFRNKIHPMTIKIKDIFLECTHMTPMWLHVEASLF
jgi:hypothetical protein